MKVNYSIHQNSYLISLFILSFSALTGCTEYYYQNLHAPKSEFYDLNEMTFIHEPSNAEVTVEVSDIECSEYSRQEVEHALREVYVYIGEVCGQFIQVSDDYISVPDHSIRSQAQIQNSKTTLYFEKDEFNIPKDTMDTTYQQIDFTINGVTLQNVFVITPSEGYSIVIDSIYYLNGTGLLKIFEKSGASWTREF